MEILSHLNCKSSSKKIKTSCAAGLRKISYQLGALSENLPRVKEKKRTEREESFFQTIKRKLFW